MRINYSIVFNRLGSILAQNDWKNYLILYDDYFDESYIAELDGTLKQSAMETKRENIVGSTMKIFNKESTKDLQKVLIDLNTDGLYTNFILLASQDNTAQFLSRAEKLGLFGVNYKWVLANMDLDVTKFQKLSPQMNAVMILRKLPDFAFETETQFLDPAWNGLNELGVSHNISYILNAAQLAVSALNVTYSTEATDLAQVKDLNCFKNTVFKDGENIIKRMKRITKLKDGSYDYFGIMNNYMGFSFFQSSSLPELLKLENPVAEENRFEVFAHLQMLRYDLRESFATASWRLVDSWSSSGFSSTWHLPKNVNPFKIGKTTLDGSTLKIVTVIEEPFIIKKKQPTGHFVYDGYCIEILKAIQQQVADQFNEKFDFDIDEADGLVLDLRY